jgi:succinate-semialdehyde dehydrogenase/glutarate-semialdehyde dehydrogenase
LEFPKRNDHAQGRAGAGRRVRFRLQAGDRNAALSALALAALAERAGIPSGVFSVVTGASSEIGGEMTSNPIVRGLTFTGSTVVGRTLMAQCAPTIKKLGLELGGNAPFIVFDDADLDTAVKGAMASKYRNAGQTCVCANRLLVQDNVYDAFAAKLVEAIKALKVGNGIDAGVTTGPLINRAAVAKVEEHIADAVSKGAKLAVGGRSLGGNFFEPTLLRDVTPNMAVSARGNLRTGCAPLSVQDRGGGDRDGERHGIWPRLPLLCSRHRACLAGL